MKRTTKKNITRYVLPALLFVGYGTFVISDRFRSHEVRKEELRQDRLNAKCDIEKSKTD